MILAAISLGVFLSSASSLSGVAARQEAQQPPPSIQQAPSNSVPDQGTAQEPNPSPASKQASPAPPAAKKPAPGQHPVRKKKVSASNCNPAPATSPNTIAAGSPTPGSKSSEEPTPENGSTAKSSAPSDCPPSRTVVRHGGATEPTIHLAGGPAGDQAVQQRATAAEMLEAAEQNLKQIEPAKLTANQQDMVKQIRQFMEQSKAATAAGDLDRARTLAWKAQLLSEELLNPQK